MLTAGSCVTPGGSLRSSLMLRNSFQNFRASLRRLVTTAATDTNPPPGPGASRLGDILTHREAWQTVEGFRQPDWRKIGEFIHGRTADETGRAAMWHDASLQWLHALQQDLGGNYHVAESRFCLLLSARSATAAKGLVGQCDSILLHLRARLRNAAWRWPHGKQVVLIFDEEEAYYRYISHFYEDGGEYGTSSGIFLKGDYRHVALHSSNRLLKTLAHEFVHLCLSHLAGLPKWINEGMASYLARELLDTRSRTFDGDSAKLQRTFWTPATIQGFWSGRAFHEEETEKMSYNLAELFVGLLWREFGDLGRFIIAARRDDGGESAAREHLGISLGEVAAAVLGEGDWQPEPPARSDRA